MRGAPHDTQAPKPPRPSSLGRVVRAHVRLHLDRAARARWLDAAARLGLTCRGVLHLVIGGLAIRLVLGELGRAIGWKQAIFEVAQAGHLALLALVVGLLGYGVWRVVQAVADTEGKGTSLYGIATRASFAADGIMHVGLVPIAAGLLFGHAVDLRDIVPEDVAVALATRWGRSLLFGFGALVTYSALAHLIEALRAKFADDLPTTTLHRVPRAVVVTIGRIGIAARGALVAMIGVSTMTAAFRADASLAKGVAGSIENVARLANGRSLLSLLSIGILAYALFCFLYARYRRIAPVDRRVDP